MPGLLVQLMILNLGVVCIYLVMRLFFAFLLLNEVFNAMQQKVLNLRMGQRILVQEMFGVEFQVHTVDTYISTTSD